MVFPSVPVYLDPPNWNQAQANHQAGSSSTGGLQAHQLPPPGVVPPRLESTAPGSIRPNSMAERARLAKLPQPEIALKCPRCESTNTKFCYFNNYSLTQPRHFCKTCRRYWTRGGALRNVPVGGGCRRNKRSKSGGSSSSSKPSAINPGANQHCGPSSSASTATSAASGAIHANIATPNQLPNFMASNLHPLDHYGVQNVGMNFSGMQGIDHSHVGYQDGGGSSLGFEQWRLHQIQQYPFLGGMDPQAPSQAPASVSGLFPFDGEEGMSYKASSSGLITQFASVKMEDNPQRFGLPRQYISTVPRPDQYWTTSTGNGGSNTGTSNGGWTDLSGSLL
ncbi:hypothetical protein J5N97_030207 [Dioscorea zingiberensis]|uniref:Dof zinc finger protein n=1 Tax=Dioscorea zingiberensis TaxID=325984 RepID=A0A9D5BXC5_9LILI|nr:hypothetical protein J5N97_030207 [Dioscorea zingiberensis]